MKQDVDKTRYHSLQPDSPRARDLEARAEKKREVTWLPGWLEQNSVPPCCTGWAFSTKPLLSQSKMEYGFCPGSGEVLLKQTGW